MGGGYCAHQSRCHSYGDAPHFPSAEHLSTGEGTFSNYSNGRSNSIFSNRNIQETFVNVTNKNTFSEKIKCDVRLMIDRDIAE